MQRVVRGLGRGLIEGISEGREERGEDEEGDEGRWTQERWARACASGFGVGFEWEEELSRDVALALTVRRNKRRDEEAVRDEAPALARTTDQNEDEDGGGGYRVSNQQGSQSETETNSKCTPFPNPYGSAMNSDPLYLPSVLVLMCKVGSAVVRSAGGWVPVSTSMSHPNSNMRNLPVLNSGLGSGFWFGVGVGIGIGIGLGFLVGCHWG